MKNFSLLTIAFLATVLLSSCNPDVSLSEGPWRAVMIPDTSQADLELPFNLNLKQDESGSWIAEISNSEEIILIDEITETEDSVTFLLPVFEGFIKTKKTPWGLIGTYTHKAAGRSWSAPITLEPGKSERFASPDITPLFDPSGKWKVIINPEGSNPEIQVGEFQAHGNYLTGTFLTVVGDYRYLEGKVSGDRLMLSCFDGAHSLIFTARLSEEGNLEDGVFCGGPRWSSTWRAEKDPEIELPDAGSLTFLKPGYSSIEFSFPDLDGNQVQLSDEQFIGKAVIIQIIGSWCPNCMDETRFFAGLHEKYNKKGLEIIALCYESADPTASRQAIRRFKQGTGAGYTFLHAGVANKRLASETLPMLNRIISYPTSIFINKEAEIQKIFTGFTGPGTGEHYKKLSKEMIELVEQML